MDNIFFTAINPNNVEQEKRINISINDDNTFAINDTPIDAQQLAELSLLLLALADRAGINDLESTLVVLDGFDIPIPHKTLVDLATKAEKFAPQEDFM